MTNICRMLHCFCLLSITRRVCTQYHAHYCRFNVSLLFYFNPAFLKYSVNHLDFAFFYSVSLNFTKPLMPSSHCTSSSLCSSTRWIVRSKYIKLNTNSGSCFQALVKV